MQETLNNKKSQFEKIVAVDSHGNFIPEARGVRKGKYVGMFYFVCKTPYSLSKEQIYFNDGFDKALALPAYPARKKVPLLDIEKTLATTPDILWDDNPIVADTYCTEPLFGYYDAADPWVISKHIELFVEAGIDFVAFDITNGHLEPESIKKYLDISLEYYKNGWNVPKFCFFTNFTHFISEPDKSMIQWLYDNIYAKKLYSDLWFYGPYDKPLMIGYHNQYIMPEILKRTDLPQNHGINNDNSFPVTAEKLTDTIVDFFYWKNPQWPSQKYEPHAFPYTSIERPQRVYEDTVSVSVSQNSSGAMSWEMHPPVPFKGMYKTRTKGRGWSDSKYDNIKENVPFDTNYQEQWNYALELDSDIVFLTGWNEWGSGKIFFPKDGHLNPTFCDSFNIEYSRDIEMMKNGLKDNTYIKTIENVHRFKSISADYEMPAFGVDIGNFDDKSRVREDGICYYGRPFAKQARNFTGSPENTHYRASKPSNQVEEICIAHNADNIFFHIRLMREITERMPGQTNKMNLFIRVNNSNATAFEGFQYVVNRNPTTVDKTSLELCIGGYNFIRVGDIDCEIDGNTMELCIPKSMLNIKSIHFSIAFKYADEVENEADIMSYYSSGDVLPLGRLAYIYKA